MSTGQEALTAPAAQGSQATHRHGQGSRAMREEDASCIPGLPNPAAPGQPEAPLARPPAAAPRCGGGSLSREARRSKGEAAAKSPARASLPLSTHQEAFPQQLRCGSRTPGRSQPSAAPSSHGPAPLPDSGFLPHRSELPFLPANAHVRTPTAIPRPRTRSRLRGCAPPLSPSLPG